MVTTHNEHHYAKDLLFILICNLVGGPQVDHAAFDCKKFDLVK